MKGDRILKGMFISSDNNFRIIDFKEPVLDSISKAIGGDTEQVWPRRLSRPYLMIVNGEGRLNHLPVNVAASYLYGTDQHGVPIVGDVVILRKTMAYGGKDWDSLREKDIAGLSDLFTRLVRNAPELRQ